MASVRFVLFNREVDNFTYDLENVDELVSILANAVAVDEEDVRRVVDELEHDEVARTEIQERLRGRANRSRRAAYGRRLGWYAVARLTYPSLVVETGIHDGLGSAVILLALERNAAEGHDGELLAFDIRDDVGWLVAERLRTRYTVRIGDTQTQLPSALAGRSVNMFIHDSDHSYEHESFEFETVFPVAATDAALISDNAHGAAFTDFCARHDLHPWIFREQPKGHMYPGAGFGLTFHPGATSANAAPKERRSDNRS